uniref:Pectinesterase inhibitor domain-containing protein n=1 Tax=Davidia involucrata TaxID=16924 RepID=A0A5B7BMP4_DAVIN
MALNNQALVVVLIVISVSSLQEVIEARASFKEAPSPSPSPFPSESLSTLEEVEYFIKFIIKGTEDIIDGFEDSDDKNECRNECKESYASVVDDFKKALDDLSEKLFHNVNIDLAAVSPDISKCGLCFRDIYGDEPPNLKLINDGIKKITADSIAVVENYVS